MANETSFASFSVRDQFLVISDSLYLDGFNHRPGSVLDKRQVHFTGNDAFRARRNFASIMTKVKGSISFTDLIGLAREGWNFAVHFNRFRLFCSYITIVVENSFNFIKFTINYKKKVRNNYKYITYFIRF